jgi:uncharacterized protein (TIGR03435 family)
MKKLLCLVALTAFFSTALRAQNAPLDLTGTWQGNLIATAPDPPLRTLVKFAKGDKGGWTGTMYRVDQPGWAVPLTNIQLQGRAITFSIEQMDSTYEAKISPDGSLMTGTWSHGAATHPLNLLHVGPDAAWEIPPPPAPPKPMAANADPAFDVATIKPGTPGRQGKLIGFQGRHFRTMNFNVNDLISFAYGLHAKQIIGAPAWLGEDLFDIDGVPDTEGEPSEKQQQIMVRKLLADRFKLTFHHEQRELSVFVLTVVKGGPKLTKSQSGPNDPNGFFFTKLGALNVQNMTMAEFCIWFQGSVLDRPMVDRTGLTDRYDFKLNWTPDESQFAQFRGAGATVAPPVDDPNAPPSLYTAIQEQLKLKLEPMKTDDDVIVIDHIDKPSPD